MAYELNPDPLFSYEDAYWLGRRAAMGLAMPNYRGLNIASRDLTPEEIVSDSVQQENERMWKAAYDIAQVFGGFGGLAHAQLEQIDDNRPMKTIITMVIVPGAETKEINGIWFSMLHNVSFSTERARKERLRVRSYEGCFSSAHVSAVRNRSAVVEDVSAYNSSGEVIGIDEITADREAVSLQHEHDHELGTRAADGEDRILRLVSQSQLDAYKKNRARWPRRITSDVWQDMSRNADYDFTPTAELRKAFERGRQGLPWPHLV